MGLGPVAYAKRAALIVRRLALVLAVPILVAGILAMHTMSTAHATEMAGMPESHLVVSTSTTVLSSSDVPAFTVGGPQSTAGSTVGHDPGSNPMDGMMLMTCILALLGLLLAVTASPQLVRGLREWSSPPTLPSGYVKRFLVEPPSLHALSISRT